MDLRKKNALQAPSRSGPYPNGPGCLEPWTDKRVEKGPLPVASFPGVSTSPVDSPAPPQPPETAASGSYQGGGERLKRLAFFFSTNGPFFNFWIRVIKAPVIIPWKLRFVFFYHCFTLPLSQVKLFLNISVLWERSKSQQSQLFAHHGSPHSSRHRFYRHAASATVHH